MVNPAVLNLAAAANAKDSRWLTLEVCREFQRSKCTRSDQECKFAHPPPHVEVQSGRVTACFDSIKVSKQTDSQILRVDYKISRIDCEISRVAWDISRVD